MHFFKTSSLVALAAGLLASSIQASPVPTPDPVSEYVPLSERVFPEADYIKHEALHKRSSAGYNDWGCRVSAKNPNPIVFVHGLGSNGLENWQYFGPRFALAGKFDSQPVLCNFFIA